MSFTLDGKGGIVSEVNVVPLIDILLVLLVIFMIIPHEQMGLRAVLPQASTADPGPLPETIIVTVRSDGSLRINQLGSNLKNYAADWNAFLLYALPGLLFFKVIELSSFMRWPRLWISCTPPALPRSAC